MKNREIKFRAWLHHPEEMVTNFWVNGNTIIYDDGNGFMQKQVDNEISIMQFTGLTDKNGKEIYEGDVVMYMDGYIFKIIYSEMKACFSLEGVNRFMDIMATVHDTSFTAINDTRFEIIGNIYENPELLNG